MRILQVITSLEMGGAETLLVNMIPRLQALGHVVDLCVAGLVSSYFFWSSCCDDGSTTDTALRSQVNNMVCRLDNV